MGQRYWVIGGEYRDCRFERDRAGHRGDLTAPSTTSCKARTEWQRLTFRDRCGATDALLDLRGAACAVSTVLDRPRIVAEPSSVPRRRRGPDRRTRSISSPSCTSGSTRAAASCSTARIERQTRFDAGELPDFREDTRDIREADWTVGADPRRPAGPPRRDHRPDQRQDADQRAQLAARKVFMADFEDATSPIWDELVQGQVNLRDHWLGRLDFTDPDSGKHYAVGDNPAVLMVRPRGWHLPEDHVTVDGEPVAGALFDFALYLWHNARAGARPRAPAPISICPSSRAGTKRRCGATSSPSPRTGSGSSAGRSRRRC